ncbi:helix-turn-helix domain-containing protein [Sulfurimonas sediminis]|nr:helix-turn-helix transcriptional regulator [Sulfurimonas sediminis]
MIGEQLKKLRKDFNLTQAQLGKELGVGQRTVSAWEAGVNEPPASVLITIFKTWGVTPTYFLLGKQDELEYLLGRVRIIAEEEHKEKELVKILESFIQKYHFEQLNSIVRSFKIGDLAKQISEAWSGKGERMLIVLYYFIEHLESQEAHQKIDKKLFIDILKKFKIPKKIQVKHLFTLSSKDKKNLIEWAENNLDDLDAATLFADIPKTKNFIQKEVNFLNRHLL